MMVLVIICATVDQGVLGEDTGLANISRRTRGRNRPIVEDSLGGGAKVNNVFCVEE